MFDFIFNYINYFESYKTIINLLNKTILNDSDLKIDPEEFEINFETQEIKLLKKNYKNTKINNYLFNLINNKLIYFNEIKYKAFFEINFNNYKNLFMTINGILKETKINLNEKIPNCAIKNHLLFEIENLIYEFIYNKIKIRGEDILNLLNYGNKNEEFIFYGNKEINNFYYDKIYLSVIIFKLFEDYKTKNQEILQMLNNEKTEEIFQNSIFDLNYKNQKIDLINLFSNDFLINKIITNLPQYFIVYLLPLKFLNKKIFYDAIVKEILNRSNLGKIIFKYKLIENDAFIFYLLANLFKKKINYENSNDDFESSFSELEEKNKFLEIEEQNFYKISLILKNLNINSLEIKIKIIISYMRFLLYKNSYDFFYLIYETTKNINNSKIKSNIIFKKEMNFLDKIYKFLKKEISIYEFEPIESDCKENNYKFYSNYQILKSIFKKYFD